MKKILPILVLVSMTFLFSSNVLAYNEFDLYLDYIHAGRTETEDDSTDYNLVALGIDYLSDGNFLTGAEFGFGSSAAYNDTPKTSQNYTNLKFGLRVLNKEKFKLDPVVSVFSITEKSSLFKIETTATLIGPEIQYLFNKKFSIDFNYYFSLSCSSKMDKQDIGDDAKLSKYELKFKYAIIDNGSFVLGLRNIAYSVADMESANSGFALGYYHKF